MLRDPLAEDRPVVQQRREAVVLPVHVHEGPEHAVALARQRAEPVDVPAAPHRVKDVVIDVGEKKRVVVHAHPPLVAQVPERVPARHGVEPDHPHVALGPARFSRPDPILTPAAAPARARCEPAEPHVHFGRGVHVRATQIALVPDQHVRRADRSVVGDDGRERRVQRVAVARVVGRVLSLAEPDDGVAAPALTRAGALDGRVPGVGDAEQHRGTSAHPMPSIFCSLACCRMPRLSWCVRHWPLFQQLLMCRDQATSAPYGNL